MQFLLFAGLVAGAISAVGLAEIGACLAAALNVAVGIAENIVVEVWRLTRRYLIFAGVLLGVSLTFIVVGLTISESFFTKSVFVASGGMLFGALLLITLYFSIALAQAITMVLDRLHGVLHALGTVIVRVLQQFELAGPPAARVPVGNGFRGWVDTFCTTPPLLWTLAAAFLACWPTWVGAGAALVFGLFLMLGHTVAHKLGRPSTGFWTAVYVVILPIFFVLWILQAFLPAVLPTLWHGIANAGRVIGCQINSATAFCEQRKLEEIARGMRSVMSRAEDAAEVAANGGTIATHYGSSFMSAVLWATTISAVAFLISGLLYWLLVRADAPRVQRAKQLVVSGVALGVVAIGIAIFV